MLRSAGPAAAGVLLLTPLAGFAAMRWGGAPDPHLHAATLHFWIVSGAALLSAGIGVALLALVDSVRTTRNVFLALGFVSLAVIFSVHGLSTPGFIAAEHGRPYGVIVSAGLSQVVCAGFIALSVLPYRSMPERAVRRIDRWVVAAAFVGVLGYFFVALANPQVLEVVPRARWWDSTLAGATVAMLGFAAWRYHRAWRLTGMAGQGAMVAALVLLAEAQVSMYYGTLWNASWWMYHGLLLAAFAVLIAGWAFEAVRARSLVLFPRAIALRDELDHLNLANPQSLERLEEAMQEKDEYTRHHMGRVAEYGVAIAREMRLEPNAIKVVEIAGRIHDIGKIVVPDSVLMKPGTLTAHEYEQMKHHAAKGEHIARSSKVLASVAAVIRAHHERFSGSGYPDGLAGDRIPLEARIIAVADTFDALTSRRVYRGARPVHEAVAELERVAGTQLDPRCVAAFVAWLERSGRYVGGSAQAA